MTGTEQFSFFPTEAQQIQQIEEAESVPVTPFAFFCPQETIDDFLQIGSNEEHSRMRIVSEFSKGKSISAHAAFLANEFHGGYGLNTENGPITAWYGDDGIHLASGNSAQYAPQAQLLTWEDAARRIGELLDSGQFATNVDVAEAFSFERKELAQALWYLKHDLSEEARAAGYLSEMDSLTGGTFPEETERLTAALADPEQRDRITAQFQQFADALDTDRTLLRFRYHHIREIKTGLEELSLPRWTFSAEMTEIPEPSSFITEDELNTAIAQGSGFSGGKERIFQYWQEPHTLQEKAAFLKKEHGTGGRSPALSGATHSDESHDSKGQQFKKPYCPPVQLPWTAVAKRIDSLISNDRYLTPLEKEKYQAIQDAPIAYNSAKEQYPDSMVLYQVGDYFELYGEDAKTAAEELDLYLTSRRIPDVGRVDLCSIPARRLEETIEKLRDKHDVTISSVDNETHERRIRAMLSIDHEAERAINEYEAEHGADGYLAFPGNRPEEPKQELTQEDIDEALLLWNGDPESQQRMYAYMREHGRERTAADWLAKEYGGVENEPLHFTLAGTDTDVTWKWTQVQRRLLQLMAEGRFPEEQKNIAVFLGERGSTLYFYAPVSFGFETDFGDVPKLQDNQRMVIAAPVCYHSEDFLAAHNITFLKIDRDIEGVQLVGQTAEAQISAMEQAESALRGFGTESVVVLSPEGKEDAEHILPPRQSAPPPTAIYYEAGDTVYLDGRPFEISEVRDTEVELRDLSLIYPLFAIENREYFEDRLRADDRNEAIYNRFEVKAEPEPAKEAPALSPEQADLVTRYLPEVLAYAEERDREGITSMVAADGTVLNYMTVGDNLRVWHEDGNSESVRVEIPWSEVSDYQGTSDRAEEPPQVETQTEPVAVYPAEETNLPYDIVVERISATEPDPPPQNFRITDESLGIGGAKAKFRMNLDAIHLLKELEAEGRQASPEEQEVLSRYVGWGGLADAFDESKENWKSEFTELSAALTPEEYAAARASTLNAHYTSPTVIRAMYEAVGRMGFTAGNILEPSMGVGNFFGMLPVEMSASKLYGVELDSITGRMAKQLYPDADITVAGFETTDRRDFYDLAVGNVPFGQYQVNDPAYNKLGFSIHNYFFAKALDQVRPGGVVAFVTSRYTMDGKDNSARKYIAERADFLGAIRLPNNAFKANAGTEVVSDIIFLQKRDRPLAVEPDWVHLGENPDGFAINSYFADHPEMILGRQTSDSTQYGRQDFTVEPIEGLELKDQLADAIQYIRGTYKEAELPDLGEDEADLNTIPADPAVKNYSYTVVNGEVYYRQNSIMVKPDLNATAKERVKGLVGLRDCVRELIDLQMDENTLDSAIVEKQSELNRLYDGFSANYGLINDRANRLAFSDDSSYYLLCSLEILDENRKLAHKADMFTKRTIKPHAVVTAVDTASEALALSISEKAGVDMAYMSQLTGKSEEKLAEELLGVVFRVPTSAMDGRFLYQTADEYLSGNVREKLREAQAAAFRDPAYEVNVAALEKAQPKNLDASEIEIRLGATWIDADYIQQFMEETFHTPFYQRGRIQVHFSPYNAEWNIQGKSVCGHNDVNAYVTFGTPRINAYKILEDSLNLRDVRIYDTVQDMDGNERRVLNAKETTLAQQKQQTIKDAFQDWIWKDAHRRTTLVAKYNALFNANRPREYDGRHITFSGMNPEIHLREHQLNAIAHVLYGGNTLLAHEVGAGKTFEMVAAAMECKRLGLCQKSLFVVPNHLIEQWASEFLRLYPSANLLVATKKDFEPANRKKFCARIATGDFDAVIIGHSQFEKIPVSRERQEQLLWDQIDEIETGIAELKANNAERFTIKDMERTKRQLEAKLRKLQAADRKDDVVSFEQLGVDRLFVDEAHNYKNLFLYTKMRNVAGLSTTDAQKSSDMFMKCRYIDEMTGGKGVIFATGTPVSNSMTELYTMMRYLQHDTLQKRGLAHFDCWASTFGETTTAIELAPEGYTYVGLIF